MFAMIANVFQAFSQVFQTLVLSISFVFFCMLHLDISKINWTLHMRCAGEAAGGADDVRGGVGDVQGGVGPLLVRSLTSPMHYTLVCSLCAVASGR
jgi:hypothetical protein